MDEKSEDQIHWEKCCSDYKAKLREENEKYEVTLAGITAIAIGCGLESARECVEKRQWAFHPALADVLSLRDKYEALQRENERLKAPVSRDEILTFGSALSAQSVCFDNNRSVLLFYPEAAARLITSRASK